METNDSTKFIFCNNEQCCKKFNYIDVATVHFKVEGPDPRDHCANERNMLTWLRTGMVLALIGKMGLLFGNKTTVFFVLFFTTVHYIYTKSIISNFISKNQKQKDL